jgi:hypothetical protein
MSYIGTPIDTTNQFQSLQGKRFSGDGSTTAFTLDIAPSSTLDIEVFVENVRQDPNSAYTLSGTTLSFTGAPPSGTNNIYVVHQAKAVGTINPPDASVTSDKLTGNLVTPGTLDVNGQELILDADADTSITADTDDRMDFKAGGTDTLHVGNGVVTLGTPTDFGPDAFPTGLKVKGDVLIGDFTNDSIASTLCFIKSRNTTVGSQTIVNNGDEVGSIDFRADDGDDTGYNNNVARIAVAIDAAPGTNDTAGLMTFSTTADGARTNTERMRLTSSGGLLHGKTSSGSSVQGIEMEGSNGALTVARTNNLPFLVNRLSNDGDLIALRQDGTSEGTISVSGSTVSYNGFTGTHWSRLADNSKPTILKGTILESLDEMMDWYQAVADVAESTDANGNVTHAHKIKESIALGSKNVGDSITFTSNGAEYTGKIEKEGDIKHAKCKVSDSSESKAVYGVFIGWDEDEDAANDMYVAQTGTYVIRIHKDETVSKGDLIQSKGDGTGKVQADDIIRASTVAKVLSTTKIETYSDGSYIVPCSLHC